ncbi:hypothetical protein [Enterococcus diestrammenae]|uniref:Uncharacterized protein n=1 Tax=Enterococcus diestrammenae TaxID=1155073 RepID=A0ABV0F4T4_9ENTE|nr:hypothetical protein [Enterococcus diestrammenae]KAF1298801.1 hypothetical protein BAU18_06035 [Enterococcus diestrammenae]
MEEHLICIYLDQQLIGYGLSQGLTIGLPRILGFSASFEDGLISNDWKRETAKEFMINGVAAKEKSMRPYQKFEILKEKAQMQVIPVSILTELAEESTGNLVETIQNYTVNQLSITSGNQYRVYVQKES